MPLTIDDAQYKQPWNVPYSDGVVEAHDTGVKHILGSHAVLHAIKSLGKIAAVYEKLDHGAGVGSEEQATLQDMSADLMIIALRLANLHGFRLSRVLVDRVIGKNGVGSFDVKVD